MKAIHRTRLAILRVCWLLLVLHLADCDSSTVFTETAFGESCLSTDAGQSTLPAPATCTECQACARTYPVEETAEVTHVALVAAPGGDTVLPVLVLAERRSGGWTPPVPRPRSIHISSLTSAQNAPPALYG